MDKLEYLDALKRAMPGLPPDVQARTLAYYEQRFVDGVAAGRGEADVARELDDPKKIAMTLRANVHLDAFGARKNPANLLRLAVSAVGLAFFNLFMIVPAMVYSALLFALYVCALAFYLAGIATTASGLAGANELALDWPSRFEAIDDDGRGRQVRVEIGDHGILVRQERPQPADPQADDTLRISTDMDAESRTTQTLFGLGLVLGGIALFLLSLVVTRYTFVGLKRYVQMNRSLLKGS